MLFDRLDKNLHAGNADLTKRNGKWSTLVAADPTGSPIRDTVLIVDCAKIASYRHVPRLEFKPDSGRLQGPATNQIPQRIVSEEAQVTRSTSRSYAGLDRNARTLDPQGGQGIQVGRLGRLKLG